LQRRPRPPRARHSTTDEKFKSILAECDVPADAFRPIKIGKAIKALTSRHGFSLAASMYHSMCNMCHHNGSAQKMLTESFRMTNEIKTRNGRTLALKEKGLAITVGYPASHFTLQSLTYTARVAWWSAHSLFQTALLRITFAVSGAGILASAIMMMDIPVQTGAAKLMYVIALSVVVGWPMLSFLRSGGCHSRALRLRGMKFSNRILQLADRGLTSFWR
jgi:hypothetical protein